MYFKKYFLVLGASMFCLSIADAGNAKIQSTVSSQIKSKTKLTEKKVLLIARQIAKINGLRLADFQEPEAHYELVHKDQSWVVFFKKKVMSVDGDIMIIVNDRTSESYLHHGG
ncbi:hypothetical protein [Undibacterium sp. TS12]|uniref:hypothetical protein n=1 Tax=Undibacterium sp. TS12 TaxID=2908202 RepID=UPI001F4D30CB|nr:hypothetical protein [Undibacterium sp. TS12]MCH8620498.1 hypothetical protein [Undibacterium sp. TS12]